MTRAQAGLEYLIIIAAVLGIAAIVIYSISGVLSSQSPAAAIGACKKAATDCKASRMLSPNDPCLSCDTACTNPTTSKEVAYQAKYCCTKGLSENIYANSPGCGVTLFSDGFSDLSHWTGAGACTAGWCANLSYGYSDSNSAYMNAYGASTITHTQPTSGYSDIGVSFTARECGDDGEYLKVYWSDGSSWNPLDTIQINAWTPFFYALPPSASNNPNFAVKFECLDVHNPNEWSSKCPTSIPFVNPGTDICAVDDFKITGAAA